MSTHPSTMLVVGATGSCGGVSRVESSCHAGMVVDGGVHCASPWRLQDDQARSPADRSGDDADAKKEVIKFMGVIGYDAIDIGGLADSCRMEPGSPIYVWPYAPELPKGMDPESLEAANST